jgi:hypothetical protein
MNRMPAHPAAELQTLVADTDLPPLVARNGLRGELPEVLRRDHYQDSYHNDKYSHLRCYVAGQATVFTLGLRTH